MGPETFPGRLAQARRRLGVQRWEDINEKRLAELVGTTTATMSRWVGGQMPSRKWLKRLSAVLGVTERYLEYGGADLGAPPAATTEEGRLGGVELGPTREELAPAAEKKGKA